MQAIQPALTVTIVRHAETMHDLIRPRIISGQESQPLTAAGKEQAKALAVRLSRVKFSEIYASDAQQAVETLEQVVQYQQGSKVFLDQRLRECNVGKISGMSYSEIIAFSNACSMSLDNFIDQDGESTESFLGRIQDFYSQLIKDSIVPHLKNSPTLTNNYEIESADTRNILAITHGGWIDSLMRFLINDLNFELETGKNDRLAYKTSIYQFKIQKVILDNYDNYEWQGVIDMMNDAGHLATLSNELNRSESVYRIPKEDPIERSFTCRKEIAAMLGFFCPFQPKYQQKSSPLAAFPVNLDFNIVHDPAQNYSEENDSEIVQKIRTLGW
jgi:broad specificity phosphatase PhoE